MTYRSDIGGPTDGYTNENFGYAQSWMMLDIAALQYLYGADFTAHSGNTTYKWNRTTGEMLIDGEGQGTPGANRVFLTIWDGGGNDTYDMSNYGGGVTIDLAPGSFSITSRSQLAVLDTADGTKARGNVFNAMLFNNDLRSLIENAIGGGGNDKIFGNTGNNQLVGNAGKDTINGLAGQDQLLGGGGGDTMNGGFGNDTLTGGGGIDTIIGNDGNDRIIGGAGADKVSGGAGNDVFFFASPKDGGDLISDFSATGAGNNDVFEFTGSAFTGLSAGSLSAAQFQSSGAATAQGAAVRFFFETDTGC